jgi:hypothetical protein
VLLSVVVRTGRLKRAAVMISRRKNVASTLFGPCWRSYTELDRIAQQHINKSLCLVANGVRALLGGLRISKFSQMIIFILQSNDDVFCII